MITLTTGAEVAAWRARRTGSCGFVPTMGCLHAGHLSLVQRARAENDVVVASVFVNPAQFGPHEDLATYPRDIAADTRMLEGAGTDLLFAPEADEIYPPGHQTWVEPGPVAAPLEGAARPGHFRGVATVVLKLLNLVGADRAYFGQKDAQQLAVVRTMVRDLNVATEIVACPTVREPDGLAMSSRNSYLAPDERAAAAVLYRSLGAARDQWLAGDRDAERLRDAMLAVLAGEPLAQVEYVSVADADTLEELSLARPRALLSLAVRIGATPLIDNLVLDS